MALDFSLLAWSAWRHCSAHRWRGVPSCVASQCSPSEGDMEGVLKWCKFSFTREGIKSELVFIRRPLSVCY